MNLGVRFYVRKRNLTGKMDPINGRFTEKTKSFWHQMHDIEVNMLDTYIYTVSNRGCTEPFHPS